MGIDQFQSTCYFFHCFNLSISSYTGYGNTRVNRRHNTRVEQLCLQENLSISGKNMEYMDPVTNEKFIPYCVEPSVGVDRLVLAFLCDAYDEEELEGGDVRTVLHLHPALAPFKVAVMPLQKNKLGDQAKALYAQLSKKFMCDYDETGSIGKRYRRQDEIGTPYCICVDFDTEATGNVTVRDRDTMQQEVVAISELNAWLEKKLEF